MTLMQSAQTGVVDVIVEAARREGVDPEIVRTVSYTHLRAHET